MRRVTSCVPWSQCPIYPQRSSHGPLFQLPLLGYLHLIWPVPRTRKRAIITERKPGNVQDEASGCRPRDGCTEWLRGIATRGREMHAYMHGHLDPLDEKKKGRKNWQKQSRGTEGGGVRGTHKCGVSHEASRACMRPSRTCILHTLATTPIKTVRPATALH